MCAFFFATCFCFFYCLYILHVYLFQIIYIIIMQLSEHIALIWNDLIVFFQYLSIFFLSLTFYIYISKIMNEESSSDKKKSVGFSWNSWKNISWQLYTCNILNGTPNFVYFQLLVPLWNKQLWTVPVNELPLTTLAITQKLHLTFLIKYFYVLFAVQRG